MKPFNFFLAMLMIFTSGLALARGHGGHFGGSHFSGGHSRGSHFSGRHFGRSHVGLGVFIGAPAFWYDPYPYYDYYPPVVVVPSSPPTYVEQSQAQPAPSHADNWWYYCAASKTYYPYVKQCPGGWQRVAPQPPDS